MGVDIWAGQIVLERKSENPDIHLIAAVPWPGFARRWNEEWKKQYDDLIHRSDLVVNVCEHYHKGVFQQRNEWMVDRSNRVIAFYNGSAGGTRNTIEYAQRKGIEVRVFETAGGEDAVNYEVLSGAWEKDPGMIAAEDVEKI